MKSVLLALALAHHANWPCQSVDPGNCRVKPDITFESVAARQIMAVTVLESTGTAHGS